MNLDVAFRLRELSFAEIEAIRRIESRGLNVDYAAIHEQMLANAKVGRVQASLIPVIYRAYFQSITQQFFSPTLEAAR